MNRSWGWRIADPDFYRSIIDEGYRGYAKDREDEWLLDQFPPDFKGYAVELGACDGVFISCTKLLEENGWTVLCIEPNPVHQDNLRKNRRLVMTCACASDPREYETLFANPLVPGMTQSSLPLLGSGPVEWTASEVTVLTLNQCLMVANFPSLDALVLDVDGMETQVIEGFDIERWNPKAVIIEGDALGRLEPFLSRGYKQVGVRADDNRLLIRGDE